MGLLCDLFVATREDALSYESLMLEDREASLEKYHQEEFKGLTTLEFGTLWAILEDQDWNVDKHMLVDVEIGESGESWLHQFQDEYVTLLAGLDDAAVLRASEAWSATEELECAAEDVRPVIEALVRLSRDAIAKHEGLFTWGSL